MSADTPHYKLLDAFDRLLVDELDIDLMLFTSFQYDPDFFEQNILLKLDESIDRLQQLEEVENVEQRALEHGVVVFHDLGRLSSTAQKVVGIPTVPVGIPDGFFHPKVVVVSGTRPDGERVVGLMVTSANLTQAGWGKNVEAGGCIADVRTPAVAEPLGQLLRYLLDQAAGHLNRSNTDSSGRTVPDRIETVTEHLDEVTQRAAPADADTAPRLHVTLPTEADTDFESRHLLDYLHTETKGPLTFGSPYFSFGQNHSMFDELEEHFADRKVAVAPGRNANGEVELEQPQLQDLLARERIDVRYLPWDDEDEPRRQHLKFIGHGDGTIVGSHNATFAALGSMEEEDGERRLPTNVEVSLEWPGGSIRNALAEVSEDTLQAQDEVEAPEPVAAAGESIPRFSLIVDWSTELVEYASRDEQPPTEYDAFDIKVLGTNERIPFTAFEHRDGRWELPLHNSGIDRTSLAENKQFRLFGPDDDEALYVGFFNERNRDRRTKYREPSPFRCLQVWCRQSADEVEESKHAEPLAFNASNTDREAGLVRSGPSTSGGTLGNYFYIYRATARMLDYIDRAPQSADESNTEETSRQEQRKRARTVLKDGSGSILHIVDYLQEDPANHQSDSTDDQTGWLRRPLPRALLAAELELVLDRVEDVLVADADNEALEQDEQLVRDVRQRLHPYAEQLADTVEQLGGPPDFLREALTDKTFFDEVLQPQGDT